MPNLDSLLDDQSAALPTEFNDLGAKNVHRATLCVSGTPAPPRAVDRARNPQKVRSWFHLLVTVPTARVQGRINNNNTLSHAISCDAALTVFCIYRFPVIVWNPVGKKLPAMQDPDKEFEKSVPASS